MRDYTHLFRSELPVSGSWRYEWDLFLSAFNSTKRVQDVFEKVKAAKKIWIIHNEYGYPESESPPDSFTCPATEEDEFVLILFEDIIAPAGVNCRICIDITGFMRPHMMFLVNLLAYRGYNRVDVLYSEPDFYIHREETRFSEGFVHTVREVASFSGTVNNDRRNDVLILGAGYEDQLIKEVADDKEMSRKVIIFGFPSLRADMYQQNALKAQLASDAVGDVGISKNFAPANDPFVTATVLSSIVYRENRIRPITNLYLSPVATKAQALGFVLYYMCEREGTDTSIIFPFNKLYARGSSGGVAKIWLYELEFPVFLP